MNAKNWLLERIAEESGLQKEAIDCDELIENFNLDSLSTISIAFDLESELNIDEINPSVFTEFNTINKLSQWIQNQS